MTRDAPKRSFFDLRNSAISDDDPLTQDEHREQAIAFLRPSRFAMHREFVARLSAADVARIRDGAPLVVLLSTEIAGSGLETLLRCSIDWLRADDEQRASTVLFQHMGSTKPFDADKFIDLAGRGDLLFVTTDALDEFPYPLLVDLALALEGPGPEATRDALVRRYGVVPDDLQLTAWPPGMTFDVFDIACAKAADAAAAWALANRLAVSGEKRPAAASGACPPRPLADLRGYGEAMIWAQDLVLDVASFRAGEISWSEVSPGALLVGPPGTGKSTLAASVAAAASLHLVSTSYAAWQGSASGHLGDVTRAIAATFETARRHAPSLVFIDEIDSLQSRGASERHDDWWRAVMNAVLTELDAGTQRTGFTVLAACNDAAGLDPALLRSGRLERRLTIGLPDADAMAAILAHHLGGGIHECALRDLAASMAGMRSGADAAALAREARRRARRHRRDISVEDVVAVAFPADDRPEDFRRRIAVHEAGHIVVALTFGIVPSSADMFSSPTGGQVAILPADRPLILAADFERTAALFLAGRAAEILVLGNASSGSGGSETSDLAMATRLVSTMVGTVGLGGTLVYDGSADRHRVEAGLQAASVRAQEILVRHRDAHRAFTDALLERRLLSRSGILDIARAHGLFAEPFSQGEVRS